jgi:lysyl endopeptidase
MRSWSARRGGFLLAILGLAALPAGAAPSALSAEAPVAKKARPIESLRLAPEAPALRVELPAPDPAEITAMREANTRQFEKRLQIGIGRPLSGDGTTSDALHWEAVASGVAAHWEVVSRGAHALRIGLEAMHLPRGAQLRFAGSGDPATVYGPFSIEDVRAMDPIYWSPVLEGERGTVEVFLPFDESTSDVSLELISVSHLIASPSSAHLEFLAKSAGACEVDLICLSATDAALASTGRAVARMSYSDSSGSYLCTGTLLNTTNGPGAPYFYTAAHCISTQAAASTLTTHWFYDRDGCGSGSTSLSYVQLAGGATMLYADAFTDVSFMRLNATPPAGAVYAGWDASTLANGTAFKGVHHPAGDLKKVSLGSAGGFSAYGGGAGTDHIIALWDSSATGVTEGGSSGSGIFTPFGAGPASYQLRGGLHGGPSICGATGAALRDYYSRFDLAYPQISQYLNPAAPACAYSISPAAATAPAAASSSSFGITTTSACAWTAASNDGFITTTSNGTGSGTVSYSVAANSGGGRAGTISVGGKTFTLTQDASSDTDLSIARAYAPNPAVAGKDLVFTFTVANAGPALALNVAVTHPVPAGSSQVWASPGCVNSSGTVTCFQSFLQPGQSAVYKVVVRPAAAGTVDSNVSVAADTTDPVSANNSSSATVNVVAAPPGVPVPRYRLYSDVTKEHHFTTDLNEYNVLGGLVGTWTQEGMVGKVLDNPGSFNGVVATPYYRLYDNTTRWHHWTTDANEYYTLSQYASWSAEGVDGYILPANPAGTTQLYRLNYPYLGSLHHWTIDANEYSTLIGSFGWVGEGGAGFVVQ